MVRLALGRCQPALTCRAPLLLLRHGGRHAAYAGHRRLSPIMEPKTRLRIWDRMQVGELVRLWEYDVRPGRVGAFVAAYGPSGDWARLFAGTEGYLGTELFCSTSTATRFVTVDRWSSAEKWAAFLGRARAAYDELDDQLGPLTLAQRELR